MAVKIRKRNGTIVKFNRDKITQAIRKAGERTGDFGAARAEHLTNEVIELIDFGGVTDEDVQDAVERALMSSEYIDTAESYILFRVKRNREMMDYIYKRHITLYHTSST